MTRASRGLFALALLLGLLGTGCAGIPQNVPRVVSTALDDTAHTRIGRQAATLREGRGDSSGVYPLSRGIDAFAARLYLAGKADRSIDVQYYFILNDLTGGVFVHQLLAAADRGVRVRVLIDDIRTGGLDESLGALASHANVEIRVFNPFSNRGFRGFDFVTDFARVNRRMHNKSFTVDNQVTIVGGRNIGDEYFEAREDLDFGDLDLLAIGPVVDEVSDSFDAYWNSTLAFPIEAFSADGSAVALDDVRARLAANYETVKESRYAEALGGTKFIHDLERAEIVLDWGPAFAAYDLPEKALLDRTRVETHLGPQVGPRFLAARTELLVISPYFVPGEKGVQTFAELVDRGVRVVILTNSLSSTDVAAVHTGYARYRKKLLELGVEIYELRADATKSWRKKSFIDSSGGRTRSQASLHAKVFVGDRELVFIGSYNFDPRSSELNTELGLLVESTSLGNQIAAGILGALPEKTYRVELAENGSIQWVTRSGGDERIYHTEPDTTFWQRFGVALLSLLPIEGQL